MFYPQFEKNKIIKRFLVTTTLASLVLGFGFNYKNQLLARWQAQFDQKNQENVVENSSVLGVQSQIDEQDFVLKLYNLLAAYRKNQKLQPLVVSKRLEQSSTSKLQDMIDKKYWQHYDQDSVGPWYFFNQAGYYFTKAGENLAFAASSPWQVFTDWKNSPAHNEQLLTPEYQDMGLAIDCRTFADYYQGGCLVVLHLGSLK